MWKGIGDRYFVLGGLICQKDMYYFLDRNGYNIVGIENL